MEGRRGTGVHSCAGGLFDVVSTRQRQTWRDVVLSNSNIGSCRNRDAAHHGPEPVENPGREAPVLRGPRRCPSQTGTRGSRDVVSGVVQLAGGRAGSPSRTGPLLTVPAPPAATRVRNRLAFFC